MTNTNTAPTVTMPATAPRGRRGMLSMLANPKGLWRFMKNPATPKGAKFLALLALAYVVVPTDAIPDIAPVVGWLDDLGMVGFSLAWLASQAAKHENALPAAAEPTPPASTER